MLLENFKSSPVGVSVMALLSDPKVVNSMIIVSHHGVPAVQELSRHLQGVNLSLTDEDKKNIGKCVREVMEENGWTTDAGSRSRVWKYEIFKSGAVYYLKEA